MKRSIIVKLKVEGLHQWGTCPYKDVEYLKFLHRHTFGISCKKSITHLDRDIEFIQFKHEIEDYLKKYYDETYKCYNFQGRSCEMIAEDLLEKFDLDKCEVDEDGEFFGVVEK